MDVTSNPIIVNAADVAAGPVVVWVGKLLILNVEFTQYTVNTDNATLNQSNGKLFTYLSAAADLETVRTGAVGHSDGLAVPIHGITNGTLRIYHKP
jgi:hypothetical protein